MQCIYSLAFFSILWFHILILSKAVPLREQSVGSISKSSHLVKSVPGYETYVGATDSDLSDISQFHLVEFDILLDDNQFRELTEDSHRQKRKAIRSTFYHWPGAEMPYEIHSSIDAEHPMGRQRIEKAMIHWQKHTCIKFVKYNPNQHRNYVSIRKGQWCASKLGMTGGAQPLYLAAGCMDTGTIIHELGHTLGWVHEQARPDRDNHVMIDWKKIPASYLGQYEKHGRDYVNTFGIPYDYGSIMHYPSYGEIITRNKSAQGSIGQRVKLSFLDIKLANVMYKCAERSRCDTWSIKCRDEGYMNSDCKCVCPFGGHKTCIEDDKINKPNYKPFITTITPKCSPWNTYDNAYIPGNNDDVGFGLTVEQCKERCMQETAFDCQSFDYWKQRRQCYLSAASASSLGIRFARDARMVHYERTGCHENVVTPAVSSEDIAPGDGTLKPANRVTTSNKRNVTTPAPSHVKGRIAKSSTTTFSTTITRTTSSEITTKATSTTTVTKPMFTTPVPEKILANATLFNISTVNILIAQTVTENPQLPTNAHNSTHSTTNSSITTSAMTPSTATKLNTNSSITTSDVTLSTTTKPNTTTNPTPTTESWLIRYRNRFTLIPPRFTTRTSRRKMRRCPFEYTDIHNHCIRPSVYPKRPVRLAKMECQRKLGARLWHFNERALNNDRLLSILGEHEFWVHIRGYKSTSPIADYFDFCPYLSKENGKVVIKDAMCVLPKPFFCQLR